MSKSNSVFIATSLDGYIADKNGEIEWLNTIPNPYKIDMEYGAFVEKMDAIVMGRNTFETICSFGIDWPYDKPVFVLSNSLQKVPENLAKKVHLTKGSVKEILHHIHGLGFERLYIDGGKTIQFFLNDDAIDELVITLIPVVLGGGTPLFSNLKEPINFQCVNSTIYLNSVVQNHFIRKR